MDIDDRILKILDLSEDKEGTLRHILKLLDELEVDLDVDVLCDIYPRCEEHDKYILRRCYNCKERLCKKCHDLFIVDDIYLCHTCYKPNCVEYDQCYIDNSGMFIPCRWCLGMGWSIRWIIKDKKDDNN